MFTIRPFKTCPKCGETKPATREFWQSNKSNRQFCNAYCRACTNTTNVRVGVPLAERFWKFVNKSGPVPDHMPHLGPCWLWTGALDKGGYGKLGKTGKAHRVAWELAHGPVPAGLKVLHACDRPACARAEAVDGYPSHLFLGTTADNNADAATKGRSARGVRSGKSKLTDEEVLRVRALTGKIKQADLAAELGVSQSLISHIQIRRCRKLL